MIKEVINVPSGDIYDKFIEYAFSISDVFMFMICDYGDTSKFSKSVRPFLKSIEPHLILRYNSNRWPANITLDKRKHILSFYKCCEETKSQLLRVNGLYNWGYPDLPEDLCFFINGYCWFMSTSHESFSCVNSNNSSIFIELKNIGFKFDDLADDSLLYFFEKRLCDTGTADCYKRLK